MATIGIYLVEKCSEKNEKDKKSEEETSTNSEEKTTSKTDEKEKSDDNAVKEFFLELRVPSFNISLLEKVLTNQTRLILKTN